MAHRSPESLLPSTVVTRLTRPFIGFLHIQAAGGVVLLLATIVALVAANTGWAADYAAFWERRFRIGFEGATLDYPLWYWINDALMAIFFFVIGLEIKREMIWGELRDRRNVTLPAAAAVGGVVVPVLIYLLLQRELPGRAGWATPMATDIAFVVGCLALLGPRVPSGLKIFVLSLAIIDDILAVIVIALFFTASVKLVWLAAAAGGFGVVYGLNRAGLRPIAAYVILGALIWLCTLKAGIHPTVAGALLGLLTPAQAWLGDTTLVEVARRAIARLEGSEPKPDPERHEAAMALSYAATETVSPLERLERALHPWVSFAIMPVFALANAAVPISVEGLAHPIAIAVALGLALGKPLGILGASWLVIRLGWARLPGGASWTLLLGAACLCGIGFTMAIFIASLSLSDTALTAAKSGILTGSAISLVAGMAILYFSLSKTASEKPQAATDSNDTK